MPESAESEKGKWRFSHVTAHADNVCESYTEEQGETHDRWLYPDWKMEYVCACHRFLNR